MGEIRYIIRPRQFADALQRASNFRLHDVFKKYDAPLKCVQLEIVEGLDEGTAEMSVRSTDGQKHVYVADGLRVLQGSYAGAPPVLLPTGFVTSVVGMLRPARSHDEATLSFSWEEDTVEGPQHVAVDWEDVFHHSPVSRGEYPDLRAAIVSLYDGQSIALGMRLSAKKMREWMREKYGYQEAGVQAAPYFSFASKRSVVSRSDDGSVVGDPLRLRRAVISSYTLAASRGLEDQMFPADSLWDALAVFEHLEWADAEVILGRHPAMIVRGEDGSTLVFAGVKPR